MTLNPQALIKAAQSLYGRHWLADMAEALDVNERTVRRWAKGEYNIPFGVWADLATLCKARGADLEGVSRAIELELEGIKAP